MLSTTKEWVSIDKISGTIEVSISRRTFRRGGGQSYVFVQRGGRGQGEEFTYARVNENIKVLLAMDIIFGTLSQLVPTLYTI